MRKVLIPILLALLISADAKDKTPVQAAVRTAGAFASTSQPALRVAPDGTVWMTLASPTGEVQVARLKPGDKVFSKPMPITRDPDLALGMRRGPRIAATAKGLAVTLINSRYDTDARTTHGACDLLCFSSEDAGRSWHGPVRVNAEPGSCEEGLQALGFTPMEGRQLVTIWMDQGKTRRKKGSDGQDLRYAVSKDFGKTFEKRQVDIVYASPSGSVCTCCHPSLATGGDGSLWAMWRNDLEGVRDMYAAKWNPKAEQFDEAVKLGEGTWKIKACPMDGGGIAVGPDGRPASVWRRQDGLFATLGDLRKEIPLGRGKDPPLPRVLREPSWSG